MLNKKFKISTNPIFIGFSAWLFSFFFYSPRFILFLGLNSGTTRRDNLLLQCLDPFTRNLFGEEKTQLYSRLVQPSIANFLGWCGERRDILAILGSPGIAYIALILSLSFFYLAISKRFTNGIALSSTFAISTTMLTQWTNTHWGHPDSLSFLPISIILCFRKWWIIVPFTIIGCLNDERFILSIPFLLLWWWPANLKSFKDITLKLSKILFYFLIGIIIFILIRFALTIGLIGPGIEGENSTLKYLIFDVGLSTFLNPDRWIGFLFVVFLSYRWLWLLPLISIIIMFRKGISFRFVFFIVSIISTIIASSINADVSRTLAFAFPIIPFSISVIYENIGWESNRIIKLLNLLTFLNIVTPAAKVYNLPKDWFSRNPLEWSSPALPLPINLWRWFTSPNGLITW